MILELRLSSDPLIKIRTQVCIPKAKEWWTIKSPVPNPITPLDEIRWKLRVQEEFAYQGLRRQQPCHCVHKLVECRNQWIDYSSSNKSENHQAVLNARPGVPQGPVRHLVDSMPHRKRADIRHTQVYISGRWLEQSVTFWFLKLFQRLTSF